MKPLNITLITFGVILLIGWFLIQSLAAVMPLAKSLLTLTIITIVLGISFAVWKRFAEQVKAFFVFMEKFWWEYFKPIAAVTVAWLLLHLVFALTIPEVSKEIWNHHLGLLMVIEISVFTLCWILNKKEPFEKRLSRKLLTGKYVYLLIAGVMMIGFRLFFGELAANLDRTMISQLISSRVELVAEDTERLIKAYRAKPALEKMDERHKKAKRLDQLDEKEKKKFFSKLKEAETWKAEVQKEYAVPDDKKINWQKLWPFTKSAQAQKPPRRLSGIFKLPADGRIVSQDINGQELRYRKGEYVHFKQLGSPGKFTIINRKNQKSPHPTWTTERKGVTSSRTKYNDKIQLMAAEGKKITVQVRIIPRRS